MPARHLNTTAVCNDVCSQDVMPARHLNITAVFNDLCSQDVMAAGNLNTTAVCNDPCSQDVMSAGNLIIRAALTEPVLKAYLPSLWLFLSLSGPHLGYLCSANKLFCSGMWLFKKFTAGAPPCFLPHAPLSEFVCVCKQKSKGIRSNLTATSVHVSPVWHGLIFACG